MADIKNKNELKRRIELFLDELDYSINEKFCKETMKMMKEFIGHASHRLDCEESRVKSLKKKLKEYKDLDEQGRLVILPCKYVYYIVDINNPKYAKVAKRFIKVLAIYEIESIDKEECKYFSTKEKAEAKLKELRGSNE